MKMKVQRVKIRNLIPDTTIRNILANSMSLIILEDEDTMGEKYLIPNTTLTIILTNCMYDSQKNGDEGTMGEKKTKNIIKDRHYN